MEDPQIEEQPPARDSVMLATAADVTEPGQEDREEDSYRR